MEECPRCFWLHFHGKQRPKKIFPSLPSGMDYILKNHFDKFIDRGELPPSLKECPECSGMRLFDDKDTLSEWRNNFKGISYEDKEGNVLHGAVDNILMKGKRLIVVDYKTRGFPLKVDTHEHYQTQLNMYAFLLKKNGYETEEYAFLLFYIPKEVNDKTGEILFDTKLIKMKTSVSDAEKTWKRALNILNGPCPTTHTGGEEREICEWCKYLGME